MTRQGIFVAVGIAALLVVAPARTAQPAAAPAAGDCDRECLNHFVDQYLDAVVAHDPSKAALASNVKFTEDGQKLDPGDGLWRTATARGSYKLYMDDPAAGQVVFFGTMREADNPVDLALRLKIEGHKIVEAETIVVRDGINASRPTDTGAENFEKMGAPDALFTAALPPAERTSREELARTANKYFSGMQLNDGKGDYSFFADDCSRIENGFMATGGRNTVSDSPAPSTSYTVLQGCRAQFESGLIHFVTRIRERRFVVLDTERGIAVAFTFFDHAAGNTRTFQTPDGKTVTVGPKTPWTWEIAEAFKVENGKIRRIQAMFHRCPYGMASGWSSSWADVMSTEARW